MELPKALRILLLLTVGLPYLALKGVWILARKAWQVIVLHRGLQILLSVLLVLFFLGLWKFAPLMMDRLSLVSSAEILARNSEGRNTLDMENDLRRKAFRLGFREAIIQPNAVSIERASTNGITVCTIQFEFRRSLDFFGLWQRPVAVAGRVEEAVEPPGEKVKSLDDLLAR